MCLLHARVYRCVCYMYICVHVCVYRCVCYMHVCIDVFVICKFVYVCIVCMRVIDQFFK